MMRENCDTSDVSLLCVIQVKRAIFSTLIINGMFDGAHIRLTLTRGKKVCSALFADGSLCRT
jgi:hypothetical protein